MSGTLFSVEFVADKIPGFDLLWNALHTFIRVPVAALLAYRATTQLTPGMQVLATAVGAAIALAAHGSKTAARALVTPSPEPVSNIALSSSEDVAAVGITWLATQHPWAAASFVIALLLVSILMVRWVIKALQGLWRRLRPARRRRLQTSGRLARRGVRAGSVTGCVTSVSPSGSTQTDPATPASLAAAIKRSTGSSIGSWESRKVP